ncbi:fluoride efflux transporter CrcB [Tellurirhabdus bombi]|uniref:fluoride efflux transporter CrcB n=1 Tax=Tellurirhabdus bombi TaxID=2907205 RepID=UPI001F2BCC82|nr:fluoride efflux transporter CrcB [Tellurirhabdus bombi]
MNNPFWLVFIGGGLGSVARYGVGRYLQPLYPASFPAGTLIVNVVASLVLGLLMGWLAVRYAERDSYRLLIGVGFCGGLSTFSTFSADTLLLLQQGRLGTALGNILINVSFCLTASWVGFYLGLNRLKDLL